MIMLKKLIELLLPTNMTRPSPPSTNRSHSCCCKCSTSGKNRTQLDDRDGQGGTLCPFDSLASLFNYPTNVYANTCIIPDRANESGCYIPEAGMEMVAR